MANFNVIGIDETTGQQRNFAPGDVLVDTGGGTVIPPVALIPFGGSGALGDATLSTSTLSGVFNYHNLTIGGGQTISVPALQPLTIKCTGNFTNSGTINANNSGWPGAAGGTPVVSGDSIVPAPPGQGYGGGGSGGNGTRATFGGSNQTIGGPGSAPVFGAAGQALPNPTLDNQPGTVGTAATAHPLSLLTYPGLLPLLGGGGGGGGPGAGGGFSTGGTNGGAGGGTIILEIRGNIIEGTLTVRGAQGVDGSTGFSGGGTYGAGGGGGSGGCVFIFWGGTQTAGTVTVTGGVGGLGAGPGFHAGPQGGTGGAGLVIRAKVLA